MFGKRDTFEQYKTKASAQLGCGGTLPLHLFALPRLRSIVAQATLQLLLLHAKVADAISACLPTLSAVAAHLPSAATTGGQRVPRHLRLRIQAL